MFELAAIGQRIARRRRELFLSQEELARLADVTVQCISYAETGKRALRAENLLNLAAALNVSTDWLLSGDAAPGAPASLDRKLQALTPSQLQFVEVIINKLVECET